MTIEWVSFFQAYQYYGTRCLCCIGCNNNYCGGGRPTNKRTHCDDFVSILVVLTYDIPLQVQLEQPFPELQYFG